MKPSSIFPLLLAAVVAAMLMSLRPADEVVTQAGDTTIINTTTLTRNVAGYGGQTPLKINIKGKHVVRVEALRNQESPRFFNLVRRQLLGQWDGLTTTKAAKKKVDAVSGATLSSESVKENVKVGLDYYHKHVGK